MGYYVRIHSADWEIEDNPRSLQAMRAMPKKYKSIQRGGSSDGEKWFSWISDDIIENAKCVEDVFKYLGFETEPGDKPNTFKLTGYDSKTGQEDLFLAVMSPWTTEGSHLEWEGEDGERWRFFIQNGKMHQMRAVIQWTTSEVYKYNHIYLDPTTNALSIHQNPFRPSFQELNIDIFSQEAEQQLAEAQMWQDKATEYYKQRREKAAELLDDTVS